VAEVLLDISTFRATLDGATHEVAYRYGEALLDCLLATGLDPAYSCRDAHCGSCMAIRKGGKVRM
jgi:3-ketosteroid 9alpha-monooxygenase subunit B